jgi:hypothetical protein
MATSVRDLLIRLDQQLETFDTPPTLPPSPAALEHQWCQLARAARRLIEVGPDATGSATQRLQLILRSFTTDHAIARTAGPPGPLIDLAATTGTIGDLLTLNPIVSRTTQQAAGAVIGDRLQAVLGAAAVWTLHASTAARPTNFETQLRRLAGYRTARHPQPSLATAAWRLIGPNDPGLDGAVAGWAAAAQAAIADPRTVSQLGLQLAAAGIALICHNAAETPAAEAWEQAASWPAHLRLGGRCTELREASRDLRQSIQDALANRGEAGPTPASGEMDGHQTEATHSALQAAWDVGRTATETLRQLVYGPSRVWTRSEEILRYLPSPEQRLAVAGLEWLPDQPGIHSARQLHQVATHAQKAITAAARHYLEAGPPPSTPDAAADLDPHIWEITSAPSVPLSVEEEALATGRNHPRAVERRFL